MKFPRLFATVLAIAFALPGSGCKKPGATAADAAQKLQASFATAPPEVKQSIATVNAGLAAGDYAAVTRELTPIVTRQPLTVEQKQAVSAALGQINQAITANPNLDSKELYELRAKMFESLRQGPRF